MFVEQRSHNEGGQKVQQVPLQVKLDFGKYIHDDLQRKDEKRFSSVNPDFRLKDASL